MPVASTPRASRWASLTSLFAAFGSLGPFAPFIYRHRLELAGALIFLVGSTVATLAIPLGIGHFIDRGLLERSLEGFGQSAGFVLIAAALAAIASGLRFYLVSRLGELIIRDLRQAVFAKLISLDVAFYDSHRVGELTARLTSDAAAVRGIVATVVTQAVRAGITITGALVMMAVMSLPLTLAVVAAGPVVLLPIIIVARRLRHMARQAQDANAELSAMATEVLGANRTVKSFVQEDAQLQRYAARSDDNFRAETSKLGTRAIIVTAITFISAAAMVGLVLLGSTEVLAGRLSPGQLTQFLVYAFIAAGSLTGLSEIVGSLNTLSGATERLSELFALKPAIAATGEETPLRAPVTRIAFDRVVFAYHPDDAPALNRLSFSLRAGQTLALVGPSGAGKSTIFSLLQRFYDPTAGSITINNVDIRSLDPRELRGLIAAVEQEPTVFAGTIRDNLRFGRVGASDADIRRAADLALISEFADSLPRGLDTIVGERGVRLSGGQKQRLAIGRALLKEAPILLLDEATSALDTANERLLQAALAQLRKNSTTLVIAHRLSTIQSADKIIVVEKGRIVERGKHDTLLAYRGHYEKLVRMQFSPTDLPLHGPAKPRDPALLS
ncbi:MAG: ATP-binding cassette domain-containing protein [Hyphomicrobiales bacterium]|nr:MAG: ATP-binding cassette domain-containing protein [Hyphomicrobiales bacterium]